MERMKTQVELLKECGDIKDAACVRYQKRIAKLEEENKKLNIKVASLEGGIKGLNYTIEKLKEENQTLELWLDNKEKVNKSLREENKNLKEDNKRLREGVDAGQKLVEDLISKNRKLERDLAETQKIGESRRQECKQLRKQYQHSMGFSDFGGYKDKNE